jgi:hypothetical protein
MFIIMLILIDLQLLWLGWVCVSPVAHHGGAS